MPLHNMFGESDDENSLGLGLIDSLRSEPNLLGLLNGGSRAPTPASQFFLDTLMRATPDFLGMMGSSGGGLGSGSGAASGGSGLGGVASLSGGGMTTAAPLQAPSAGSGALLSDLNGSGGSTDPSAAGGASSAATTTAGTDTTKVLSLMDRPGSADLSHLDPTNGARQNSASFLVRGHREGPLHSHSVDTRRLVSASFSHILYC